VFIARDGEAELTPTILSASQVRDLVEQMLKVSGRRLDLSSPFVDAALPGGERLHVVIPDVTRTSWAVNIRKYIVRAAHLDDLVALGSLTPAAARFLAASVTAGLNVLVSGPTRAGNPTRCEATPSLRTTCQQRPVAADVTARPPGGTRRVAFSLPVATSGGLTSGQR